MDSNNADSRETGMAALAYLTPIGLLISWRLQRSKQSRFAAFHIKQSAGIYIFWTLFFLFMDGFRWSFGIPIISMITPVGMCVILLLGLISAVEGSIQPVPFFGRIIQKILKRF